MNRFLQRLINLLYEIRLGVHTRGVDHSLASSVFSGYITLSYEQIFRILHALKLKSHDVFVDVGCGKGRVLCCAALENIREVWGLEQNPKLCQIAAGNARKLRGKHVPIKIVQTRAEEYHFLKGTVYYFYSPFNEETLACVLERIHASMQKYPRGITIVYVNPVGNTLPLQSCSWLKYKGEIASKRDIYTAHYFHSI